MGVSARTSKISSIVAALCILIYIAAIAFGAVSVILKTGERRDLAEREFQDLADRATSSTVFLGFMSPSYQETIRDFLDNSETLTAAIITSSGEDYGFEKRSNSGITWTGNSPRFKNSGLHSEPFFLPLRIDGQSLVSIQAVYDSIDREHFLGILRNTLLAVLFALAAALITLIIEITLRKKIFAQTGPEVEQLKNKDEFFNEAAGGSLKDPIDNFSEDSSIGVAFNDLLPPESPSGKSEVPDDEKDFFGNIDFGEYDESPKDESADSEAPKGLFTPNGKIGWASYIRDRLESELHRCASFEQDLVLLTMKFKGKEPLNDSLYSQFTNEAVNFFTMRDLIFEESEKGISVIIPNVDLEYGMVKSEEFSRRVVEKMPASFDARGKLCVGLSSRSGRLIEAERLMLEASTALEKALEDPASPVVAFKSDPEKYREFVKRNDHS